MPINSTGVKTHRDHFVMDFTHLELLARIEKFRDLKIEDDEIARLYELQTKNYKSLGLEVGIYQSRRSLASNECKEKCFY